MTPERWRQIEQLYHAALALPSGERPAYLAAACPNDEDLQREVTRLLDQPSSEEGFLAGRAHDLVAGLTERTTDLAGRTLGTYELQALIGVGGMGQVYRAKDLKLGREVAIKVLPPAFTNDPNRLTRFDREARTLASLNHPNICTIHGFEHADGLQFLVLELVGGNTLAERLKVSVTEARGSGVPEREALDIALQIIRALEFAHQRGIVHRDLKPANIKVTADGTAKVLDFGLAKAVAGDAPGADLALAQDITAPGTVEGTVVGTPAYMSPEQARGQLVDKRTDIWAFGCVLYEMLTGRAAFAGDTVADTIVRVIEREPDWTALPASTPAAIRDLLSSCLAKDAQQRLRDIAGAREAIDAVQSGSASATGPAVTGHAATRHVHWWRWAAAAALALAMLGAWRYGPWSSRKVVERTLELPAGQSLDGSGGARMVTISRDGTQLAYVASPHPLYIWPLVGGGEPKPVPGAEKYRGVRNVEFSPDGEEIAFYAFADRSLKRRAVAGVTDLTICDAETPTGIHWGPNGMVLFGQGRKGIWQASVNVRGAIRVADVNPGEEAHGPSLLPDGDHYLFTIAKGRERDRWNHAQIVVQSLTTRIRTPLPITGSDARYVSTGHSTGYLIYAIGGSLWGVRFDPRTRTVQGTAVPVLEGVSRATGGFTGTANFSVSDDGTLAYVKGQREGPPPLMNIAVIEPTGKTGPRKLIAPADRYDGLRVSPDGSHVAASLEADKDTAAVFTIATNGGTGRQRLTLADSDSRHPAWTHDSRRIAFQSNRGGDLGIWWQVANGSEPAERLTRAVVGEVHTPESWAKDGTLLFTITRGDTAELWTMLVRNGRRDPPKRFGRATSTNPMSGVFSPDGKLVAYTRTEGGDITVCVEPFPSQFHNVCLEPHLADSPKHPRWSPAGDRLYYDPRPGDFESVEVITAPELRMGMRRREEYHPFRLAPPGARTPFDITKQGEFIGLIPEGQDKYVTKLPKSIVVVTNWVDTLRQKMK